jgi:hypothetical protein
MTYNSGINVLKRNSKFELHSLKLKTSWNHVNLQSKKLLNIPTITMQWNFILYYIPIQTLNFPFALG